MSTMPSLPEDAAGCDEPSRTALTLLWFVKSLALLLIRWSEAAREHPVDLASDVALEATNDLPLAQALLRTFADVA